MVAYFRNAWFTACVSLACLPSAVRAGERTQKVHEVSGSRYTLSLAEKSMSVSATQTSDGVRIVYTPNLACDVVVEYGLFRTQYTGTVPCVVNEHGVMEVVANEKVPSMLDSWYPQYELSRGTSRKVFELGPRYYQGFHLPGMIVRKVSTDNGTELKFEAMGVWPPNTRTQSSWEELVTIDLDRSTLGSILKTMLSGSVPKSVNMQIMSSFAAPQTISTRISLDMWGPKICQLSSERIELGKPTTSMSTEGWTQLQSMMKSSKCSTKTARLQDDLCSLGAHALVLKHAQTDFEKLGKALSHSCRAELVQPILIEDGASLYRRYLESDDTRAAQSLSSSISRYSALWPRTAKTIEEDIQHRKARDQFIQVLLACESDATTTNCDEALRYAAVATTEERARISTARTARVKFEAEVAAQRAAEEIAAKNARIEAERRFALEQKQKKTAVPTVERPARTYSPCDDVYVGRRVGVVDGRHQFNGVVVGVGRAYATIAPDKPMVAFVGSSYEAPCTGIGYPH
jgi:hypothetical protein